MNPIVTIRIYTEFENDFGFRNQMLVPAIGGALGCWVRFLVAYVTDHQESTEKNSLLKRYSWIFILVGALAGLVAVNLLNPKGSFAQVFTISVLNRLRHFFPIEHILKKR